MYEKQTNSISTYTHIIHAKRDTELVSKMIYMRKKKKNLE